ncbi:MAG: TolC family protein [Proteobacteria bacterium]|nr:TolC family protein [Pseudomonadota bacterium]
MYKIILLLCVSIFIDITANNVLAQPSNHDHNKLLEKIASQIAKHPEVIAAKKTMLGELYLADGLEKAIYNPELNTEFEREGSGNNYLVGISQSIDRSNKQAVRSQQAVFARITAQESYKLIVQQKMAQALTTLVAYQSINEQAQMSLIQEQQLENLLSIVKKRTASGDLGQLDAELAYLSLSQWFAQTATVQAQKRRVESQLQAILPNWDTQKVAVPTDLLIQKDIAAAETLVNQHPAVVAAKAQWELMQVATELAQKNKKPDPNFGINIGKIANDNLLSLSFSMPLYVRNNFSNEFKAANQQALAAESNYLTVKRNQYYAIVGSQSALQEYSKRFNKWQSLMQGRDASSENLLYNQWSLGDISTTEYLLTLQQRTEGLLAGTLLQQEYQTALIQLLLDTAQLNNHQTIIDENNP